MVKPNKIVYSTTVTSKGGRAGQSRSEDGRLEVSLSTPKAMGGDDGEGTNPEQLFGAGYSACFLGAIKAVAKNDGQKVSDDASVTADIGFGPLDHGYGIAATLHISLPGMNKSEAQTLIEKAHKVCPYSNATRNNVNVELKLQS